MVRPSHQEIPELNQSALDSIRHSIQLAQLGKDFATPPLSCHSV